MVHFDARLGSCLSTNATRLAQFGAGSQVYCHLELVNIRLISCLERLAVLLPILVEVETNLPVRFSRWSFDDNTQVFSKAGKYLSRLRA